MPTKYRHPLHLYNTSSGKSSRRPIIRKYPVYVKSRALYLLIYRVHKLFTNQYSPRLTYNMSSCHKCAIVSAVRECACVSFCNTVMHQRIIMQIKNGIVQLSQLQKHGNFAKLYFYVYSPYLLYRRR